MYFIARQYDFDPDNTWLGSLVEDLTGFERYCTSLYWSVVTFTTVGVSLDLVDSRVLICILPLFHF